LIPIFKTNNLEAPLSPPSLAVSMQVKNVDEKIYDKREFNSNQRSHECRA